MKTKNYSPEGFGSKTGFFSKALIILGIIFIGLFGVIKSFSLIFNINSQGLAGQLYKISISTIPDTLIAVAIIFIGFGIIFYIFHYLFSKLASIAEEIECSEEYKEENID